jgi:putative CocE/NonD family hydrolase
MLEVKLETISLITSDGIRLDADVYRPQSQEKFPILLMRQPYGRKIASTVVYAHPIWYASQGYIVVIQDVRGRGTSTGEFRLFATEINDGIDTVNWLSQLSGSTGEIGMYGFSYQGMTQLYAALGKLPALKTICPSMVAYNLYSDWAYENNAFCLQANLGWAIQLAAETAKIKQDENAFQKLFLASRHLPVSGRIPANPTIMQELAPDSFYHDWLLNPNFNEYWHKLSPQNFIENIDLPMLHIGGWFDPYLRGTLNLYQAMVNHSLHPQHLIVGPWAHLPWGSQLGAKDYGKTASSMIDKLQIQWFDYFLKGKLTDIINQPPICLFEMGSNQWQYFASFPNYSAKNYYLSSNGLAAINEDNGKLQESLDFNHTTSEDILVHDPWRPVPSLGGHASIPSGSFERSTLDSRTDILTYTSPPLTEDLHIVGNITLEVYCTADAVSFDICAVLSEVNPDGRVYNFTQGYKRVKEQDLPIKIPLQSTCIKIPQGNCLRLSLSAACFPAYPVNSGTGKLPYEERLIDHQIITLKVNSSINYPCRLIISINN